MAVNINELPKVLSNPKHTIEPVWGKDAGRFTNSGKFTGTFVGWFDTLEVPIGRTTYEEIKIIREAIEKPIINITFTDSRTNKLRTADFYGTAISAERLNSTSYKPFVFNLKAIEVRDDM